MMADAPSAVLAGVVGLTKLPVRCLESEDAGRPADRAALLAE